MLNLQPENVVSMNKLKRDESDTVIPTNDLLEEHINVYFDEYTSFFLLALFASKDKN